MQYVLAVAAIAILAMVVCDLVHEILGHLAVATAEGEHITKISTVGIQTAGTVSRICAAAGTLANVLTGAASLLLLKWIGPHPAGTTKLFLWLFGAFSLFNSGYLVFSAVTLSGDWAQVIRGLTPQWFWRIALAGTGVALYRGVMVWVANASRRVFTLSDGGSYLAVWTAYLAAALVATSAAALNPFGASLVLISGLGVSLGLNWGMLVLPRLSRVGGVSDGSFELVRSWLWVAAGMLAGGLFIAMLGPGVCLDCSLR